MAMHEAQAFVVIYPNYYGKGATLEAAVKAAKAAGYRHPNGKRKAMAAIVAFTCPPEDVGITADVGVRYTVPEGTERMTWMQEL